MTDTIERDKWDRFAEMLGLRVKDPRMLRQAGSAWAPTMTDDNRDKGLALLAERDALRAEVEKLRAVEKAASAIGRNCVCLPDSGCVYALLDAAIDAAKPKVKR